MIAIQNKTYCELLFIKWEYHKVNIMHNISNGKYYYIQDFIPIATFYI